MTRISPTHKPNLGSVLRTSIKLGSVLHTSLRLGSMLHTSLKLGSVLQTGLKLGPRNFLFTSGITNHHQIGALL